MARLHFIEEKTAFLRGRYHYSTITIFNDLQPFAGKIVARKLTILGTSAGKIDITIDALEPATNINNELFTPAGVKPLYTADGHPSLGFIQVNVY